MTMAASNEDPDFPKLGTLLYIKTSAAAPEIGPYVLWYSAQSCRSVIDYEKHEKHEKRSCMERPRWRQIAHRNRSIVVLCSHVVPATSCNEQLPCDVLHRAERECHWFQGVFRTCFAVPRACQATIAPAQPNDTRVQSNPSQAQTSYSLPSQIPSLEKSPDWAPCYVYQCANRFLPRSPQVSGATFVCGSRVGPP